MTLAALFFALLLVTYLALLGVLITITNHDGDDRGN